MPGAHDDLYDLEGVGHLASFGLPWRRRAGCQVRHGVTQDGSAITGRHLIRPFVPLIQLDTADKGCEGVSPIGPFEAGSRWGGQLQRAGS